MRVAIVGAGIAGLACAAALRAAGHEPVLFDKARGAGGRMSTRRIDTAQGTIAVDHGATHFTVRSAGFSALVGQWEAAGLAARWPAAGRDAWIGVPTMNAPLKAYGAAHAIHWSTPVTALTRSPAGWTVHSETRRFAPFDAAVVAQQMLQAVGFNIEIEVLEWATQLDRYSKGNYTIQAFPYSGRMDPALSYESMTGPKDKQPRKLWDNPEVQALLDKSMVVNDKAERQKIFDELHSLVIAEVPMVMLYNGIVGGAIGTKTKGYVSTLSSLPRAWEVTVAE